MSEERASPELSVDSVDRFMEAVDPSDESMPLLSVTENLTDNVIFINELTPPLPSLEDHLWINDNSGVSTKTVKAFDTEAQSLFGPQFVPADVMQKAKRECSECGKGFRTTNALNKHLLTHQQDRPHVCNTCQRRFKHHHHLMAHMLTHKKTAKSGCHKGFFDHHSKTCLGANPTEPSPVLWEHSHPPAVTEDPSTSTGFHSLFHFPPKSAAVSQLEQFVSCEARCSNNTGFASITGNLGLNHFPEVNQSQFKPPVIQDSWSVAAVDSNLWTPVVHPQRESATVDPMAPDDHGAKAVNLQSWKDDLNFPVTNPQSLIGVLTVQPCKEESNAEIKCSLRPLRASPKKSLQHPKPNNKQQFPFTCGAQACSKSDGELGSVAPQSNQKPSHVLPPPLSKKGKITSKTVPAPPIRPRTKKWSSLICPSQVAMASFSTESTPLLKVKEVKNESRAAEQIQTSQGFQLSPLVIPVSVPVLDKETPFNNQSAQSVPTQTEKQQKTPVKDLPRKSCHPDLLRSLIIPSLAESSGQECRATGSYPSQLRSPTYLVDHLLKPGFLHPPYTPPPMLSPLRPGTGLYFNTLAQCQPYPPPACSYIASLDGTDIMSLMTDSKAVNIEPKINLGPRFQAEIPPLRNLLLMLYDEHPAQLVWAPWGDLPTNPETQQKVTEFLNMCCSSVLPGGGTNTELALHCLHEVQGDVLAALDLLLLRGDYGTSHLLSGYHFTGSDHWSAQEMKVFRKTLFKHNKDFQLIHNVLQTKSVAQCVEYYYAMKKLKKLKKPIKGVDKKDTSAKNLAEFHSAMEKSETGIRSFDRAMEIYEGPYVENHGFPCKECGRGFHEVKSHSAHMRSNCQPEQEKLAVDSWLSGDTCQDQEEDRPEVSWSFL